MTYALSKIAMAAGLAAIASSAVADPSGVNRPLSNYNSGTTDVYLAGSSAVDLALTKFIANACDSGSLDTYRTDANGKTYYLWTCESTAAGGGTFGLTSGNTKIAIHKNTNSSGDGVNFVANASGATVPVLRTSDLAACGVAASVIPATPGISSYTLSNCGAIVGTQLAQVNFGFADSEPNQFAPAVSSQLTTAYPFSLIFGIPVTKTLRNALQQQQFGVTNDESIGRVPSISAAQINAIYTGKQNNWANAAGVSGLGGSNNVHLVRRSDGSGTTRIFNETFVGQFCSPGVSGTVTGSAVTLSPSYLIETPPVVPDGIGPYTIEGLDANGGSLFRYAFTPKEIDHAPDESHFTFAIPVSNATRDALVSIRASGGGRRAAVRASAAGRAALLNRISGGGLGGGLAPQFTIRRTNAAGATGVRLTWDSSLWHGVMVRDPDTNEVLAFGTGGDVTVLTTKNFVRLVMSDGVQSGTQLVPVP